MPRISLTNRQALDVANAAFALAAWLKPGRLAFTIGMIRHVLTEPAKLVNEQLEALRDELVVMEDAPLADGEARPEGQEPERRRKTALTPNGNLDYVYRDRDEYKRREAELLEMRNAYIVQQLLTPADIERIEADRLPEPTFAVGVPDFAALAPVMTGFATLAEG